MEIDSNISAILNIRKVTIIWRYLPYLELLLIAFQSIITFILINHIFTRHHFTCYQKLYSTLLSAACLTCHLIFLEVRNHTCSNIFSISILRYVCSYRRKFHVSHRHSQDPSPATGSGCRKEMEGTEIPRNDQLYQDNHQGRGCQGGLSRTVLRSSETGSLRNHQVWSVLLGQRSSISILLFILYQ